MLFSNAFSRFFTRMLLLAALSAASLPRASAVCASGSIGIGTFFEESFGAVAVIVANDCGWIDRKASDTDSNICGGYEDGSTVICNAGTEIPDSAQTPDGSDWGHCTQSGDTSCQSGNTIVDYCCAPA